MMIDMKSNVVTVSPKYQVVIPLSVRESAGIKPGEKMMVVNLGGVIRLMPIKAPDAYRGIARGMDTSLPIEPDRL
jgi:AbrB family looped-hinge helix DNA binding protein